MSGPILLYPLQHFPLVEPGDDIAQRMLDCIESNHLQLQDDDILVIAQKIISKAEDRYRYLNQVKASAAAEELAERADKDPRLVQCILDESSEVLRVRKGAIIVRHRNGYVHANAGIDQSNISSDGTNPRVLLLPENPDASARAIRQAIHIATGTNVNIVINDSAGRPWRNGVAGFAIGTAGFEALVDQIGSPDLFGRPLQITQIAIADELAATGSLLMGQGNEGIPVVLIRGVTLRPSQQGSETLIRDPAQDLFR